MGVASSQFGVGVVGSSQNGSSQFGVVIGESLGRTIYGTGKIAQGTMGLTPPFA